VTPATKAFEKAIRSLSHRTPLWRVFADFCEMSALAHANVVEKDPAREERYLRLIGAYEKPEQAAFPELLGIVTDAFEQEPEQDFLGGLFMSLELSSHWHGQFFTPIALCRTMAELTLDDALLDTVRERGFVTLHEPAAGAGATLIAFVAAMRARGLNPQTQLHVGAIDKDPTAAHMCFVQLSLLGVPAVVHVGDTLRMEMRERFDTMFHHLHLWDRKLARGYALGSPMDLRANVAPLVTVAPESVPASRPAPSAQLGLFARPEAA
jgi:hypothetical protein